MAFGPGVVGGAGADLGAEVGGGVGVGEDAGSVVAFGPRDASISVATMTALATFRIILLFIGPPLPDFLITCTVQMLTLTSS